MAKNAKKEVKKGRKPMTEEAKQHLRDLAKERAAKKEEKVPTSPTEFVDFIEGYKKNILVVVDNKTTARRSTSSSFQYAMGSKKFSKLLLREGNHEVHFNGKFKLTYICKKRFEQRGKGIGDVKVFHNV